MDKSRRIELMGLTLFVFGLVGIILFFYMSFMLVANFSVAGGVTTTSSSQIASDFVGYLLQITLPVLVLIVVGGISALIAQFGISAYSQPEKPLK